MESMDRVADRVVVAAQGASTGGGRLACRTGEEELTAADPEGLRGAEARFPRRPLVRRERSNATWC